MDLIAQHTVGVIEVSFLPSQPLVVREKRSKVSIHVSCLLKGRRRGGRVKDGEKQKAFLLEED